MRQGEEIRLSPAPSIIEDTDLIRTLENGKVRLTLMVGDMMFLASKIEIRFEEKLESIRISKIS